MTAPDGERPIILETVTPEVWRITLDSPGDRNALSGLMREAILDAMHEARAAGGRVMIVRGDERAFSSGYKLDPGVMRPSTAVEDRHRLVEVTDFMRAYRDHPLVTIAEVRGYCLAGGTDLMIASDVAIAADDARIGVPNVRGLGITMLLPVWSWILGPQRAKLAALTGDELSGAESAAMGLVAESYPEAELTERVEAIARRMALVPSELLSVTKHALNVAWDSAGFATAVTRAAELDAISHATHPVIDFWDTVIDHDIRTALRRRDLPFDGERISDLLR